MTAPQSDGRKVVLFVLNHWGGLSGMILMRLLKFADCKIVVLVASYVEKKALGRIADEGIVDDVISFDDRFLFKAKDQNALQKELIEYFDQLLNENGISLTSKVMTYIACDMSDSFGMYLQYKGLPFTIYEMSPGQFFLRSRYDGAYRDGWMGEAYYTRQKTYGLLCGEKGGCHVLMYPQSDVARAKMETDPEVFDFSDYSQLDDTSRSAIISCFDINIPIDATVQLVLLNSRNMVNGHSIFGLAEAPYLFQMLVQFFGKPGMQSLIKPHPADTVECMQRYFPESVFLDPDFPIEFLHLFGNIRISRVVTIGSSAADKIADMTDSVVSIGWIYYKLSQYIEAIDLACKVASQMRSVRTVSTRLTEWANLEPEYMKRYLETDWDGRFESSSASDSDLLICRSLLDRDVAERHELVFFLNCSS